MTCCQFRLNCLECEFVGASLINWRRGEQGTKEASAVRNDDFWARLGFACNGS